MSGNKNQINKKKVGIITYCYFYNYGTMLQSLASQILFDKYKQIDAEIIDYRFGHKTITSNKNLILTRIKRLFVYVKECKRVYKTWKYASLKSQRNLLFDEFAKKFLKFSPQRYIYEQNLVENVPIYDIYVTGSDQTWSPKIGFSPALFLNFAPSNAIKASYAPSIGVSSLTKEQSEHFARELKSYNFLSCRESLGSEILESIINRKVETVLDPTLMILPEQWLQYTEHPKIKGKYILCYFLGDRDYYRFYVQQLSKQTGLPIYYIPVNWKDFKKNNNLLWEVGPAEFLGLIANAEYVCTDSFHGTIFSLNFHREVRVFVKHAGNIAGGDNSRLFDIIKRLGVEKQLITEYEKGSVIPDTQINYSLVDELLTAEREKSMKYVESITNSVE